MQDNFAAALKVELTYEGGKDDDPIDPGGRTNQGIIQRVYDAYRLRKRLPKRDVFLMDNSERDEIYRTQYFDKIRFNELPPGVDLVVVDGAINSGVSQSIKWVQRALNLTADGVLGEVTMQRILDHPDHDVLIKGILDRRRAFLKALKTFYHFGKGWMARVDNLQKKGQAWAMGSVGPEVIFIANGNKKANIVDAKPLPLKAVGDITASGGTVTSTLATIQTTLEPLQGSATVDMIIKGVIIAGVLLAAGGIVWGIYARRKSNEINDVLDLVADQSKYASNDNAEIPQSVLQHYVDPDAKGSETGNIAPGTITQSGRTAGDTEVKAA